MEESGGEEVGPWDTGGRKWTFWWVWVGMMYT